MERFKIEIYKNRLAFFLFLFGAIILALIFFKNSNYLGIQDWDQRYSYAEVARNSILKYKQVPLWNPYHCGGMTQIGNPQNDVLSPAFLFPLIFGPVIGYKILLIIYLFLGLIGFYYLGLYYKISKHASILLSSIYIFSGLIIIPFSVGMTAFLNVTLLPYLYLFYLKALKKEETKYIIYAVLVLTIIFLGGYHYFLNIILFLFILTSIDIILRKKKQLIWIFIIFLFIFIPLTAVKGLPSTELMIKNQRVIQETTSGFSFHSLYMALFSRKQSFDGFNSWNASYGIDENGMYIGLLSLILFSIGVFCKKKENLNLFFVFLFFLLLSFGLNIFPSLYRLLHNLPLFDNMRVAQRYRYFFMVPLVIFIGFGYDACVGLIKKLIKNKRISGIFMILVAVLIMTDIGYVNLSFMNKSFDILPLKVKPVNNFKQRCGMTYYDNNGFRQDIQSTSSYSDEYVYLKAGFGSPTCYEPIPVISYATCFQNKNYRGEYYLEKNTGQVNLIYWSPNKIIFNVDLKKDDRLIVNQNYDSGWKAIVDNKNYKRANSSNGLLSLNLEKQNKSITIYYLPDSFLIGAAVSLISIITLLFFLRQEK